MTPGACVHWKMDADLTTRTSTLRTVERYRFIQRSKTTIGLTRAQRQLTHVIRNPACCSCWQPKPRIRLMPRGRVQVIRIQKGGSALFRMRGSFAAADIGDEQIKQTVCSFRRCPFATAIFEYTPRRADQKEDLTANQVTASRESHRTQRTISQEGKQYNSQISLMRTLPC